MKFLLFIFLSMLFARKEKLPPICMIKMHGDRVLRIGFSHPDSADTLQIISDHFFKRPTLVCFLGMCFSQNQTDCQYFTIGKFIAIRRKNELDITWD